MVMEEEKKLFYISLIGRLLVTFSGTPNFNVADSLDGAYLKWFRFNFKKTLTDSRHQTNDDNLPSF